MKCPNCASTEIVAVTYGPPPFTGARLEQAIARGEIILGGCAMCADGEKYACRVCGHRFDREKPENTGFFGRIVKKIVDKENGK